MFSIFKKKPQEEISRSNPGYEEKERRTTAAGFILLVIMFVAGLFFGWRALDDLGRIPSRPAALSLCASRYAPGVLIDTPVRPFESQPLYEEYPYGTYDPYGYQNYKNCKFNDLEDKYGVVKVFERQEPLRNQNRDLNRQLSSVRNSLYQVRNQLQSSAREYDLGLQEKQAQIPVPIFPLGASGTKLSDLHNQEARLIEQENGFLAQLNGLSSQIKNLDKELEAAYKPVFEEQNSRLRWYEFLVFLLQLIFVLPLFLLVYRGYLRLHRKNSPYTVIFTAILAVSAVLLLRVILFWFWGLFLAEVIRVLWRWIQQFELLRSIVFYLGMVLSFAVFGGAVYYLQKKIFDPRRVTIRRFRAKQCPHCQTNLDLSIYFCPNCGHQIREKCESCGQARFVGMPACPSCGNKINKESSS
jgi:predicted RNA-binding Zn-ribbon protein involved in translation (DUF1610 family)